MSITDILAKAGTPNETVMLRELIDAGAAPNSQSYAAQRTAIRACHAERYAQARDNVLTGRAQPLRSC